MRVRVGCEFGWRTEGTVPLLMLVRPRPDASHTAVYESTWTDPQVPIQKYTDVFGNLCWRISAPSGPFTVRYDAIVEISGEPDPVIPSAPIHVVEELPDEVLAYTLPTRFIESDLFVKEAWDLFGNAPPTWARVQAVCDWVHANVTFGYEHATQTRTARSTFDDGKGVCRDFTLLAIAFCRALNIPARYTCGYLPDIGVLPEEAPMDFASWFEAYVGGKWYTFDARFNVPRIGRVVIGRGRDPVDVALSTSYGTAKLEKFVVWADEITAERPGGPPPEADADAAEAAAARE